MTTQEREVDAIGQGIELRLTIASGDGDREVVVDAHTSDTIEALRAALASYLGSSGAECSLWCERRAKALDDDRLLGQAGIRWGDRLMIIPAPREATKVGGEPKVEL